MGRTHGEIFPIQDRWHAHDYKSKFITLGSYDILVSMDWLTCHRTKFDCFNKFIECVNEEGEKETLEGK